MTSTRKHRRVKMRYLYLDNVRGFRDAFVPLLDVNFLVGENSSGKTSFMNVFRMLSSERILTGQDESGEELLLGHFAEMVSIHSKDKSYFRIGFIGESRPPKKKKKVGHGILITYKNENGLSQIAHLTATTAHGETTLFFKGGEVFYNNSEMSQVANAETMKDKLRDWIYLHSNPMTNYEKLEGTEGDDPPPLWMLMLMASSRVEGRKNFAFAPMAPSPIWIAPIRTRPSRTYDELQTPYSSEGGHIPYVIKRILSSKTDAKNFNVFMKRVGAASGLFQKIEVKNYSTRKREAGPFEIDAYLDGKALNLFLMGYGVSQALPIFVELLRRPKRSWYAIQQPEVHLHPKAQAALGDLFFEMATRDEKSFLIETHSDFTIDRFRMCCRKRRGKTKAPRSQILFFERRNKQNCVTPLPIARDGSLPTEQPDSYREFFIKVQMDILGML